MCEWHLPDCKAAACEIEVQLKYDTCLCLFLHRIRQLHVHMEKHCCLTYMQYIRSDLHLRLAIRDLSSDRQAHKRNKHNVY